MTHCDAVIDRNGVEFFGDTACVFNFTRDQLSQIFEMDMPRHNCVNELTTAMMGFSKSPSFMPVARHKARAPAMLRPAVDVLERYSGISYLQ